MRCSASPWPPTSSGWTAAMTTCAACLTRQCTPWLPPSPRRSPPRRAPPGLPSGTNSFYSDTNVPTSVTDEGRTRRGTARMKTKAAGLWGLNEKWQVEEVELDGPKEHEVLVKLTASGLCHSDEHLVTGDIPMPHPVVGGHEGAGVVAGIGSHVTHVAEGDSVVLSFLPSCGRCSYCARGMQNLCDLGAFLLNGPQPDGTYRFHGRGQGLGQMCLLGTFSEYTTVPAAAMLVVELTRGHMADSLIITTDVAEADYLGPALDMVTKRGKVVITAVAHPDATHMTGSIFMLTMMEKQIRGSLFGSSNAQYDIPRMLELYNKGQLKLDGLITREYALEDVNQGYEDMRNGLNIRGLICY